MKKTVFILLAAVLATVATADDHTLSLEEIVTLKRVIQIAPHPTDDRVAYILEVPRTLYEDDIGPAWQELHLVDGEGNSRPFVTGKETIVTAAWSADGKTLYYIAKRGEDKFESLYAIPADGGESRQLYAHDNAISQVYPAPNGETVAFLATGAPPEKLEPLAEKGFNALVYEESLLSSQVWLLPLGEEAAEAEALAIEGSVSELRWSPDSKRLALAVAPTPLVDDSLISRDIHIVDAKSGRVRHRVGHSGKLGLFEWSPDGGRLAYIGGEDIHDPREGRLFLTAMRDESRTDLVPDLEGHIWDLAWTSPDRIDVLVAQGVSMGVRGVDPDNPGALDDLGAGPIARAIEPAADGSLVVIAQTPEHPDEVYRYPPGGEPKRLTTVNPTLASKRFAGQEAITYAARDGLRLDAILIRPLNRRRGAPKPLVVFAHGGPEAHYSNGWLSSYAQPAQTLAAEGYAVVYPNYRGSTGRGVEFSKMGQNDYADEEFNDLVDARNAVIAMELAEDGRVGISGGSYGGYASMWAASALTEHFDAAVAFVGISNQVSKFGTGDIPREMYYVHSRAWPWEDWLWMLQRSPVYHADKVKTPLLILAGDKDPRVHPSQSLEMYRNVKLRSETPVRMVFYPGEVHGNRNTAARYDYALRFKRWMDHYLVERAEGIPPWEIDHAARLEETEEASGESR